ncbi:MAG TPA: hypothetical protein VIY28_00420 [Pseudonocardiaceae bacterium]
MAISPLGAARRLRDAAIDGRLEDLVDSDRVDLLDVDRAGAVARQHALVPGDPLYEYRSGEFARQQMRASGQRLGTEWMRRLDLELMADRP